MEQQQRRIQAFASEYNEERPHEALGMKRPGEIYEHWQRRYRSRVEPYDYPGHYVVRRVSRDGTARLVGNQFFVTTRLAGKDIGFKEVD